MTMTTTTTFTIQLFGPYAKTVGQSTVSLSFDAQQPVTAGALLAELGKEYSAIAGLLGSARLAVNCQYVGADHQVAPTDELAVIGLVGGG